MLASTIDEVIERLDHIIDSARRERSRLGFFPALYRQVTIAVKQGIASGRFEDGPRIQRFDVIFANRYLEAHERYIRGEYPGESWLVAFRSAGHWRPLVLQHLLLGMNAHINLDLGVAAAHTCPGDKLSDLKHDFDEVNKVLSELVDEVQRRIALVSHWLGLADRIGNRSDEAIVNFSMRNARDAAWDLALKLAPLESDSQPPEIASRDRTMGHFAKVIRTPGILGSLIALTIRLRESNDVPRIIDVLTYGTSP